MKVSMKVSVALTAREWQLYSSATGSAGAARKLNTAASKALNEAHKLYAETKDAGKAISAAWKIWGAKSNELSSFGASDSEPRWMFDDLILRLFCAPNGLKN